MKINKRIRRKVARRKVASYEKEIQNWYVFHDYLHLYDKASVLALVEKKLYWEGVENQTYL